MRVGFIAMKFQTTRILFLRDVFTTVAELQSVCEYLLDTRFFKSWNCRRKGRCFKDGNFTKQHVSSLEICWKDWIIKGCITITVLLYTTAHQSITLSLFCKVQQIINCHQQRWTSVMRHNDPAAGWSIQTLLKTLWCIMGRLFKRSWI